MTVRFRVPWTKQTVYVRVRVGSRPKLEHGFKQGQSENLGLGQAFENACPLNPGRISPRCRTDFVKGCFGVATLI